VLQGLVLLFGCSNTLDQRYCRAWFCCLAALTLKGMASTISTISLLSERHFLCPLCKDIFSSPVTTPCGHSFCQACLCGYWTRHRSDYCPLCKRLFHTRPDLSVNRILADVCDNYRKTRPESPEESHDTPQAVDIDQMIQERLQKNSCLREVRESQKVFSALVSSMEKSHKAVSTTSTLGYSERRDWSKVTMETDPCMGVTRRALSDLMDMVKGELNRLSKAEANLTSQVLVRTCGLS
ncbi:unnamed protein product, partial [Coregonus sp. 'balchen']